MQLRLFLIFFLVLFQSSFPQTPPVISYPKVQSFTKNIMISPLFPSNTGGLVKDNLQVSTLAGNGLRGFNDGPGKDATFMSIHDITVDSNGNVFVCDFHQVIRKITPAGFVSTFAGTYYHDGSGPSKSVDGVGTAAFFDVLISICTDANDDLFAMDFFTIRKITKNAKVTTVFKNVPISTSFDLSSTGDFYIANFVGNNIQKITPAGVYTTIAGSGRGYVDGTGLAASFDSVVDLKLDKYGVIYVTEPNNNTIRKIDTNGVVTTFAGSSSAGFVNGTGVAAKFDYPWDIAFDAQSNLYVADVLNAVIRKITPAGVVSTYAGNGLRGDVDGPALNASIDYVNNLVCGKDGTVYFSGASNKVKKITNEPYCISPSLPLGLSFDKMTGAISGTAIALLSPTKFSVTATNEFGSSTFDIIISVNDVPPSLTYPSNNLFIKEESIAPIVPTNSGGEVISYSISPDLPLGLVFNAKTGVISGTPTVVQANTAYTIFAENTGGKVSFDLYLTVIDSFKIDTDKDGISDVFDNCPFKFNPNQLDSNNNQIGDECETNSLVVSKIVSPNGDGVNDTWMIYNIENYPELSISVFNRFGQQVYHSDDYKNDWNANELQEATYFYTISSKKEDKIELKGWFYIIK